jgi:hypothetical protein
MARSTDDNVFTSPPWRLVEQHYPLTLPEIERLRQSMQESTLLVHAIIMWGETLRRMHT